ncbi:chaperonin 10-like protein [Lentinula lateritia]|uniref:Chaperonin 10-like protein n=1 Tax=Lentinula aff. lateritia TaxID=2804960 RepID=A0ACC1UBJ2_9AGAR|nr:chaperonin 10-like protein [Lentinula aff. lateritia]KAJ3855393.1 chaperonin 10-like protein [Lentinula lateritia]
MPALPTSTAAVLHGPKDLRLEPRPLWAPEPGQCQLEVKSTGLCGSDLHYYLAGRNGDFAIRSPLVLGHESSGVITALGAGVASQYPHLRVGVRVAIECGIPCRSLNSDGSARTAKDVCKHCSNSRYNLCKNLRFCSSAKTFPHRDGMLQQKINHEAWCLHPIPDSVSYSQAALAEPLSVLLHASRRAAGKKVLVFGVGAIGLIACGLAQELGAERVCAVDINNDRLAFAARENFTTSEGNSTYCLPLPPKITSMESNPKEPENIRRAKENAANALAIFNEPDGFDVIFECTGAESCILMSVFCTTLGARIALVGMGSPILSSFPISAAATREVDLIGSFRYADTYNEAVELLSGSNLLTSSCKGSHTNGVQAVQNSGLSQKLSKLVTHRYPLNQAKEAFELLARGRDDHGGMVLKVMIES